MKSLLLLLATLSISSYALESSHQGIVKHAVFFRYKNEIENNAKILKKIRHEFLALKKKSLKNGKPYILSIDAGNANSPEMIDQGYTDGYILTFKSIEDRNFYIGCNFKIKCSEGGYKEAGLNYDKAHDKFKNFVGPLLYDGNGDGSPVPEGVMVFDFLTE